MKRKNYFFVTLLLSQSFNLSANTDPFEKMNRVTHGFNKVIDTIAFKPLAQGYKAVTPDIVEAGVSNFFANIGDAGTLVNNLLQLKLEDAAVDFVRIAFNTTIGLGGVIDVSSGIGLRKNSEDFGQTLGAWGVPAGPYIVAPFFGPGSLRDTPASFVPLDAWSYINHVPTRNVGLGARLVNKRGQLLKYEALVSGDEYIFIRDAYLGIREQAVNDGVVDTSFDDEDF